MRALILAAGLGTRLRPLTAVCAKGAVPVNGEPLVRRVIRWLVAHGFDDLVMNVHHHPATIGRVVGDGQDLGARVRYSWENPVLGSAGGPRHALPLLTDGADAGSAHVLIVNGDTLTDLAVGPLVERHRMSGARVTMALIPNPRPEQYGGVVVEDGWVRGFSRPGARGDSFHFIGAQVAQASVFAGLPDNTPHESVMGIYPELMRTDPHAIAAHAMDASFRDVGTPADYLETSVALAGVEGDRLVHPHSTIDPSSIVRRSSVWAHVQIGAGCELEDCIIGEGAVIPPGKRFCRSAVVAYRGEPLRAGERIEGPLLVREF